MAGPGAAYELAGVDYDAAAGEHGARHSFYANAFEHGIVHAHVMRFCADDLFLIGIEDDEVGVRADGDCALAWI